jgi:hypothetical protein
MTLSRLLMLIAVSAVLWCLIFAIIGTVVSTIIFMIKVVAAMGILALIGALVFWRPPPFR